MFEHDYANDNWRTALPRPTPLTPMNMIEYANSVIQSNQDRLRKKDLPVGYRMFCINQIKKCKNIKISAIKAMTEEGYGPHDICGR